MFNYVKFVSLLSGLILISGIFAVGVQSGTTYSPEPLPHWTQTLDLTYDVTKRINLDAKNLPASLAAPGGLIRVGDVTSLVPEDANIKIGDKETKSIRGERSPSGPNETIRQFFSWGNRTVVLNSEKRVAAYLLSVSGGSARMFRTWFSTYRERYGVPVAACRIPGQLSYGESPASVHCGWAVGLREGNSSIQGSVEIQFDGALVERAEGKVRRLEPSTILTLSNSTFAFASFPAKSRPPGCEQAKLPL